MFCNPKAHEHWYAGWAAAVRSMDGLPSALRTRSVSACAEAAAALRACSLLPSALLRVQISCACLSASLWLARSSSRSLHARWTSYHGVPTLETCGSYRNAPSPLMSPKILHNTAGSLSMLRII